MYFYGISYKYDLLAGESHLNRIMKVVRVVGSLNVKILVIIFLEKFALIYFFSDSNETQIAYVAQNNEVCEKL